MCPCPLQIFNRRDPSGATTPRSVPKPQPERLLKDQDLVYTQNQVEAGPISRAPMIAPLNSPRRAGSPEPVLTQSKRFEFQRRGQKAGDIGWGCAAPNTRETAQNGRIDGHALVSSDLHKRHQFMRLSGDPAFDKRAGRQVMTQGSLRKPGDLSARPMASARGRK